LDLPGDGRAVDGKQAIPGTHTSVGCGGAGGYLLRLDALGRVQPHYTIIGGLEFASLDEIQPGKNHGRQRGKR
jgi:hypothetical protein